MRFSYRALVVAAALGAGAIVSSASGPAPVALAQEAYCPVVSAVQQFSGAGDTVTEPVAVPAGLLTVSAAHQGDSNFIIWVYDIGGGGLEFGDSDLLVNEIGPYDGQVLVRVQQTSTLVFEVTAGGSWQMDMSVMQ